MYVEDRQPACLISVNGNYGGGHFLSFCGVFLVGFFCGFFGGGGGWGGRSNSHLSFWSNDKFITSHITFVSPGVWPLQPLFEFYVLRNSTLKSWLQTILIIPFFTVGNCCLPSRLCPLVMVLFLLMFPYIVFLYIK